MKNMNRRHMGGEMSGKMWERIIPYHGVTFSRFQIRYNTAEHVWYRHIPCKSNA